MINYLIIFIVIVGIIKCLSMLVVLILSLSNIWRTNKILNIKRESSFYNTKSDWWCIIPTIAVTSTNKFFEIKFQWFSLIYYAAYSLEFKDDE